MFTFKEMLKGVKRKNKRKRPDAAAPSEGVPSKKAQGSTTGTAQEFDDGEVQLGAFPQSVHKLWQARKRGWIRAPASPDLPETGGAMAICATVVDKLPHEALWRRWMEEGAALDPRKRKAYLHIHAKHPDALRKHQPWAGERTLDFTYSPNWNDVRVARAMLALLRKALENKDTHFMLLCTESCVPIRSLSATLDHLWAHGAKSWINAWQATSAQCTKYEQGAQFDAIDASIIPSSAAWKGLPGWVCLTRHHAQAIVDLESRVGGEMWPAFDGVFAPEELFFPTMLALAGFSPDARAANTQVVGRSLMFAQWPSSGPNRANPHNFDDRVAAGRGSRWFEGLATSGYLFARKFKEPLPDHILAVIFQGPPATDTPAVPVRDGAARRGSDSRAEKDSSAAASSQTGTLSGPRSSFPVEATSKGQTSAGTDTDTKKEKQGASDSS